MKSNFERVLIDGWEGVYYESWQLSSENFSGIESAPWRIHKYTLYGGKQHGVDIVELHNGEMTVVVVATRGMNILSAYTEEVRLGWDSPVREVVHPAHVAVESRGGLGMLEGFNELVCRCGLESHGAPGEDVIVDNEGNEKRVNLALHGRIANTPAVRVWVNVELEEPHRLSVSGEVYETRMFGPSYKLLSTVSTVPGSAQFRIEDRIENLGGTPAEMELLYHCNYGPPLLEKGARLLVPLEKMSARDERALEDIKTWDVYGEPEAGFVEQCYFFTLHADRAGKSVVGLLNAEKDLGVSLRFSTRQLPAFTLWKNTAAEEDGYVTGLEPGTDYPNPRKFEREKGRVVKLAGGDAYEAQLEMALLRNAAEASELQKEIEALTSGKESRVAGAIDADLSPVA